MIGDVTMNYQSHIGKRVMLCSGHDPILGALIVRVPPAMTSEASCFVLERSKWVKSYFRPRHFRWWYQVLPSLSLPDEVKPLKISHM